MVNDNAIKVTYTGDGQTTVFPFSFPFDKKEYIHIAIYDTETQEIEYPDRNYIVDEVARTVTYPGYEKGQEIKESERPAVLDKTKRITIFRSTNIDQLVNLGTKYPLATIEGISDKITEILQELREQLSRAILVKLGSGEDPQKVYDNIWEYAKKKAEEAFGEPAVTDKIQQVIDEATAAAQKELEVLDANDILGKIDTLNGETEQLKETTDSITATVAKNKGDTDKAISEVKQTADGITATVAANKKDADTAISKVDQKADSISATVQANKTSTDTAISNVNQRADSITSTVQQQKEQFDGKIGGLSSQITQNADSITSVITNLKDTDKAKAAGYSAITQLQDEINLRVKTADYNGKNIVNQINLNSGGVLIDGTRIHITGDTKIDKNLIVGGNIKAGSLTIDNLSESAVRGIAQANFVEGDDGKYCRFTKAHSVKPSVYMLDYTLEDTENYSVYISRVEKNITLDHEWELPTETITTIGATDISENGFRINARVAYPKGSQIYVVPKPIVTNFTITDKGNEGSGVNTYTGYETWTAPNDCKNAEITVTYRGDYSEDRKEYYNGRTAKVKANASIELELFINGVSQFKKSASDTQVQRQDTYKDIKKGDVIQLNWTCKNTWSRLGSGEDEIHAYACAHASLIIHPFTPTSDIKIRSGKARFLMYDIQNKQYTLED